MPKFYSVLKWLVLAASYIFLTYKLITFNHYGELAASWNQITSYQIALLFAVFLLLPINWFLEAIKWKKLTSTVQDISYLNSIKAVLVGISTGFFTPNRVGELVGRIMFLQPENRKSGVTLSFINSITQNLVMALCGIPATILFFSFSQHYQTFNTQLYIGLLLVSLLVVALLFIFFPIINEQLKKSLFFAKVTPFTDCLLNIKTSSLLSIIAISFFRYIIFCTQFWFMLQVFSIELSFWQAIISIPTTYLFVTFTPSMAFSEVAVRSSYAVIVIGAYSSNVVGIALAGVSIWAVNFIIPMLVGSVIMMRKRE